jgi:hypothetical protein
MESSFKNCALAGCVSVMVSGCAAHQNMTPEYRLSSSAPAAVPGASMLQRGRAQLDAGLDALAIESFRSEIRQNPEGADAYNGLAVAYGRIGRNDLAQRYFETALAKDPANVKAQTNLAKLTGEAAPFMQLAAVEIPTVMIEPVAITSLIEPDPIGRIIDNLEAPVFALAELPQPDAVYAQPQDVLAKQGVLSSKFAIAPARLATIAVATKNINMAPHEGPAQPPLMPQPFLPPANLPSDYRNTGTRLERVSLGEVRLITRSVPPVTPPKSRPDFDSFGDRLAAWLPLSVAAEQVGHGQVIIESSVIMAAVERAEQEQKLARSAIAPVLELFEFAYLFFQNDDDIAKV